MKNTKLNEPTIYWKRTEWKGYNERQYMLIICIDICTVDADSSLKKPIYSNGSS